MIKQIDLFEILGEFIEILKDSAIKLKEDLMTDFEEYFIDSTDLELPSLAYIEIHEIFEEYGNKIISEKIKHTEIKDIKNRLKFIKI